MTKNELVALTSNDVSVTFEVLGKKGFENRNQPVTYVIPLGLILVESMHDEVDEAFCGVFEVTSIFSSTAIHNDILDNMHRENVEFNLRIVQKKTKEDDYKGPLIVKEYNNCHIYQQELLYTSGSIITFRYYFTNIDEPWEISIKKIESLRPPNQVCFDYAVSKSIKNLDITIKEVMDPKRIEEIIYKLISR
jgi:hypothetical protein